MQVSRHPAPPIPEDAGPIILLFGAVADISAVGEGAKSIPGDVVEVPMGPATGNRVNIGFGPGRQLGVPFAPECIPADFQSSDHLLRELVAPGIERLVQRTLRLRAGLGWDRVNRADDANRVSHFRIVRRSRSRRGQTRAAGIVRTAALPAAIKSPGVGLPRPTNKLATKISQS